MDQLKVILAQFKKHQFWILAGLVLMIGIVGWKMATAALADEAKGYVKVIDTEFKSMIHVLRNVNPHPNGDWEKGVIEKTDDLKTSVAKVWERVFTKQKDFVLQWPEELGEDFINAAGAVKIQTN